MVMEAVISTKIVVLAIKACLISTPEVTWEATRLQVLENISHRLDNTNMEELEEVLVVESVVALVEEWAKIHIT